MSSPSSAPAHQPSTESAPQNRQPAQMEAVGDSVDYMRLAVASIGMEPVLLLYMTSTFIRFPVFQSLLYEKACIQRYGDNPNITCTDVASLRKDEALHTDFNHIFLVSTLCLMIPSLFSSQLLGSLTDAWSAKIPMVVPFVGLVISGFNDILQAWVMPFNPYLMVLSDVIFGLCGGFISVTSTIFAYSMRSTSFTHRSERVAALEGAIGIGAMIGSFASGQFGYVTVFILILILNVVSLVYILLVAKEIELMTNESIMGPRKLTYSDYQRSARFVSVAQGIAQRFKDVWKILSADRDRLLKQLTMLTFFALALEFLAFAGISDILFSFVRNRYSWTDKQYGIFNGVSSGLGIITILFVYPVLHKRFDVANSTLSIIGVLSKIVFLLMLAFGRAEWVAYVATIPHAFNRYVATGLRAMVGQFVFDSEQGRAFCLIALVECISRILATTVFNGFFPKTLKVWDGIMFVATAGLIAIPLLILIYIRLRMKRANFTEDEVENLRNE